MTAVERVAAGATSVVAAAAIARGAARRYAVRSKSASVHDWDMVIPRLMLIL
jgi:hypothetical protein